MENYLFSLFLLLAVPIMAQLPEVPLYEVYELSFTGPSFTATDNPVRDVVFSALWRHESGSPTYRVYGFYFGDSSGRPAGNIFKVRFTPTREGEWILEEVTANVKELQGQQQGQRIRCVASAHPGFWEVDEESAGRRWYQRSDGSHPFIVGNTMYTFLSGYGPDGPSGNSIAGDIRANAAYYNKLRFAVTGDIYPHPEQKPFLDAAGKPTDDGNFSHRPNPQWFSERVDVAVQEAFRLDMIADLILNGPDSPAGRSSLLAGENGQDPEPFLRYIAARYSSYPNVWICLSNEYNILQPSYTSEQIVGFGRKMAALRPYPTPLSVHANQQDWDPQLNTVSNWNDHAIIQNKLKRVDMAADVTELNYWKAGGLMPVINDELAYEGAGDNWSEDEVLMAFLGTFLGGGYGSTGDKPGRKLGSYFAGNFSAESHRSSDNLRWLRQVIEEEIGFWDMQPFTVFFTYSNTVGLDIFRNVGYQSRLLYRPREEYVFGGSGAQEGIVARLPAGKWEVNLYDLQKMEKMVLTREVEGNFTFDLPDAPAAFVHFRKRP